MLKLKSQQCYEKNKEQIQEKKRQHNRNNKGKIKEQDRKYKQKNNEATKARGRRYYEKNKERMNERMRQHREKNKDKTAERRRQLRNEKKKSNWYWNSRMKRLCQVMRISWHIFWLWSVRPMIFWLEHFLKTMWFPSVLQQVLKCHLLQCLLRCALVPVAMCASACCYVR